MEKEKMYVLIACEESQRVCAAFREKGHIAFSCDVIDASGGHPEWHIKQDVTPLLNGYCTFLTCDGVQHELPQKWDLIIAHPPCTYLTIASAVELSKHPERLQLGFEAADFFKTILSADCEKIVVENPIPMKRFLLPKYNQIVRAYQLGENHQKAFCLWLKGVPELIVDKNAPKPKAEYEWVHSATGQKKSGSAWYNKSGGKNHRINRSKTPESLAQAMAE